MDDKGEKSKKRVWTPVDFIVAGLTVTICAAILGTLFIAGEREDVEEGHSKQFVALLSAVISIISMYVGSRLQAKKQ